MVAAAADRTQVGRPAEASMASVVSALFRPAAASATGLACVLVGASLLTAPRLRRLARLAPDLP